ncbi:hypothetical protein ACGFIW_01030 [Micromonospora sp. NPDC048935]|uniref:hypothetical protein n=1 Tax=Micromonospora sp. NPDC048935 TaxID=3364262 RepID=UPI0037103B88
MSRQTVYNEFGTEAGLAEALARREVDRFIGDVTTAHRTPHPAPSAPHPAPRTKQPAPRTPRQAPRTPRPATKIRATSRMLLPQARPRQQHP